jgi:hypothetical protein
LTQAIASALITAAVLGLWFSLTRGIAIVAVAIMAASQPWLVVPIAIGSAAAFYVFRIHK